MLTKLTSIALTIISKNLKTIKISHDENFKPFNIIISLLEWKGRNVEIHFNRKGARKWADLTKSNIGNILAFTIDNQIYTMPKINAEIKTGEALINGLGNETLAKSISESLNFRYQGLIYSIHYTEHFK